MNKLSKFILGFSFALSTIFASDAEETKKNNTADVAKMSEAFGHLLGKNLGELGVTLDVESVIRGLRDSSSGKNAPMSESECLEALTHAQKKAFDELAHKNLKQAEEFLESNKKSENIIALEGGKVQYKVLKLGSGLSIKGKESPVVRYIGKYLDGNRFGASKDDEVLSLDEIIPGLKTALIGMKEGEKRMVYIHPDLAYGTHGYLPPNSLLVFEIEVVKADAAHTNLSSGLKKGEGHPGLLEDQKSLR